MIGTFGRLRDYANVSRSTPKSENPRKKQGEIERKKKRHQKSGAKWRESGAIYSGSFNLLKKALMRPRAFALAGFCSRLFVGVVWYESIASAGINLLFPMVGIFPLRIPL
jgi:hypothetical protein